ncbi:Ldh family oxidoreductase [Halomonas dongshanensis]|uniref:Ldh family oxidoreductase n=1 Tax=Halomonas dongshanensis TaxID=2890835 RepID=A0ABT2EDW7_9GAMM|nr:Ldh family oxidoreductase [Halomonas dongshanensis]MCS2609760.1 Ldh family oxidoreductase [Halomonas dongshanensis]
MTDTFSVTRLRAFSTRVFQAVGLNLQDAETVTDVLIHADLRGHASHGLTRIPIYAERIHAGVVNAHPDIQVHRPSPAFLMVDADNAPGPVASLAAVEAAIETAKKQGVCACVVAHSNHNGPGSYYAEKAIEANCIFIGMTNAPPSMAVFGGREAVIGTNPFTFGSPVQNAPALVLDMATSVVARGKIVESAKRKESIPDGWALDREGKPTTDAQAAEQGVVLPFGGPKGSAMAIMGETLCGVLAGGRFAGSMGNLYSDFERPQDIGHFFLIIDTSRTHLDSDYAKRVSQLRDELKTSAPADGVSQIKMPGEVEYERSIHASERGILLPPNVVTDLDDIAQRLNVPNLSDFIDEPIR